MNCISLAVVLLGPGPGLGQFPRSAKNQKSIDNGQHLPQIPGPALIIRFSQVPTRIIVSLTVFRSG